MDKTVETNMDKIAEIKQYFDYGVELAFDAMSKHAEDSEIELKIEDVEKVAEARATRAVDERVKLAEFETTIEVTNQAISFLDESDFKEAADALSKVAIEELSGINLPSEDPVAVKGEEVAAEKENTPEEVTNATVQGAAEVIAEITNKEPTDPEVIEAAEEIVQEAISAVDEAEAGAGSEE